MLNRYKIPQTQRNQRANAQKREIKINAGKKITKKNFFSHFFYHIQKIE